MARRMRPKLITPDTLRTVDREYRDLVMSLRALAALLHDPDPTDPDGAAKAWEPVLANILDAELNQLAVLVGDLTAALRMENQVTGPVRSIDLSRVLESAVRRTGSRVLMSVSAPVRVAAHPEIVAQAVTSALSLALRVADGRVTATTQEVGERGVVSITVPLSVDEPWSRWEGRLALLRRIVDAEGGRVAVQSRGTALCLNLSFPLQRARAALRPA